MKNQNRAYPGIDILNCYSTGAYALILYKAFLKNQKRSGTSISALFSA